MKFPDDHIHQICQTFISKNYSISSIERKFLTAIRSALTDIRKLGYQDLIVEEQGFSTLSEMAERASLSRQVLSLYALNKRGDGNFPKPMYGLSSKSAMYSWPEVATWLFNQGKLDKEHYEVASAIV